MEGLDQHNRVGFHPVDSTRRRRFVLHVQHQRPVHQAVVVLVELLPSQLSLFLRHSRWQPRFYVPIYEAFDKEIVLVDLLLHVCEILGDVDVRIVTEGTNDVFEPKPYLLLLYCFGLVDFVVVAGVVVLEPLEFLETVFIGGNVNFGIELAQLKTIPQLATIFK